MCDLVDGGLFAPVAILSTDAGPDLANVTHYSLAVADFDRDGIPDIALSQFSNSQIGIFFGNGDGSFSAIVQYPDLFSFPASILPVVPEAGGQASVLVVDEGGPVTAVGMATLQAERSMRVVSSVQISNTGTESASVPMSVADLNGDGVLDFVVFVGETAPIPVAGLQIMLGDDGGGWVNGPLLSSQCVFNEHFIGDFNEDGVPDIIAQPCMGIPTPLHLLLGNGDGTFVDHGVIDTQGEGENEGFAFLIGDLNGDGHLDVLYESIFPQSTAGTWVAALGRGDATFITANPVDLGMSQPYALADVDGDGRLDYIGTTPIVGLGPGVTNVRVALGNGDGTFQPWMDLPMDAGVGGVVVADVNNDGKPDLVASDGLGQTISVFLNCR